MESGLLGFPLQEALPAPDRNIFSKKEYAGEGWYGLINALGTDNGKKAYTNPGTSGLVVCTQSTTISAATQAFDHTAGEAHTNTGANQWWKAEFKNKLIVPKTIGLYGRDFGNNHPRNFIVQGSNDDVGWTDLYTASGTGTVQCMWWIRPLSNPDNTKFRFIRVYNTGADSSGGNYLVIGELELWGELHYG